MPEALPVLPEELLEYARALTDPVRFAERYLKVQLRDYQKEVLRDLPRRLLFRWGRQVGKSFTCALLAVWYAFTHENARVVVVYPVEDQVHAFFRDHVRPLIAQAPDLFRGAIDQDTRHPEAIAFHNGSTILGFTAGTKANSQAVSVRGQGADLLILDEMHYMTDEDINSLLPLVASRPHNYIVAASTCRVSAGKFFEFYQNAHDPDPTKRVWVDSHVPGWRSPAWDPEKSEHEWKVLLGEDGYIREIAAEFPAADTTTVFAPPFVRRATRDYPYLQAPLHDALRTIGADWDVAQATPNLCVVEWDPAEVNDSGVAGVVKVILREEIPRSEFTLDSAVQRIIALNQIFRPRAIYVDRGFGEYQVEMLRKMGRGATSPQDPAYGLDKIVKGISFSSNIEVPDPVTGEVEKKPIKPFMVNQLALLFQRDQIRISAKDPTLVNQLLEFKIKSVGSTGRPIYSDEKEHAIDALALAVLAFVENYPDLLKTIHHPELVTHVARTAGLYPKAIPLEPTPAGRPEPPGSPVGPTWIRVFPPETDPNRPQFVSSSRRRPAYGPSLWPRGASRIRIHRQAAF